MESNFPSATKYDVIIVGLGCVGISAAYYLSKMGLKVLGIEKYGEPGSIGTSSYGFTRIWRLSHYEQNFTDMQAEALEIWREIEQKSGQELLRKTGMFWAAPYNSDVYKFVTSQEEGGEKMNNQELKARYPALSGLSENMHGFFSKEAGIVRVQEALQAAKKLAIKQGATLIFNTEVKSVDKKNGIVTLENGQQFNGNNIVLSCGSFTDKFYQKGEYSMIKDPQETYVFSDNSGFPPTFIILGEPSFNGHEMYGLYDGPNHELYKIGYEAGTKDNTYSLQILRKLFPTKYNKIIYTQPCSYAHTDDNDFIFERKDNIIYAFGLGGRGFKHMPYHGKRIYNLVVGNQKEADKYKISTYAKAIVEPVAKL
eukprot:403348322